MLTLLAAFLIFSNAVTAQLSGLTYAIESIQFSGVYLRMDGSGCTSMTGPGCGTVNAQYTQGPYEEFILHQNADGYWGIESKQFPNAYLRMDGSGCTASNGAGEGSVNAQYYASGSDTGGYEEYEIVQLSNPDGAVAFQSVSFPNCYVRLDGSGITSFNGNGEGTVNGQYYSPGTVPGPGTYEMYNLVPLPSTVSIQNKGSGQYLGMDEYGNFLGQSSSYNWTLTYVDAEVYTIQIAEPNTAIYPSYPWFLTCEDDSGFRVILSGGPASENYCQWTLTPLGQGQYTFWSEYLDSLGYGYGPCYEYNYGNIVFTYPPNQYNSAIWVLGLPA